MNSNLNSSTQFSNDADLFAYRGQAARLRSQAIKNMLTSLASRLHLTGTKRDA